MGVHVGPPFHHPFFFHRPFFFHESFFWYPYPYWAYDPYYYPYYPPPVVVTPPVVVQQPCTNGLWRYPDGTEVSGVACRQPDGTWRLAD